MRTRRSTSRAAITRRTATSALKKASSLLSARIDRDSAWRISSLVPGKPSAVIDTRVIYCGDNLDQLRKLPEGCVDLIYIDPPFNSNRNYEVFWGETKEKRSFEDRHESTKA